MAFRLIFFWFSIGLGLAAQAQEGLGRFRAFRMQGGKAEVITTAGTLTLQAYEGGIVQTTFEQGLPQNEQISDAVILKPVPTLQLLRQDADNLILKESKTLITITKNPVRVTYVQGNSKLQLLGTTHNETHRILQFALQEDEKIFGTGARSITLNRRGYRIQLDNNPWYGYNTDADNLNYSIPFYVSSHRYGVFLDNPSRGYMDIGKTTPYILEAGFRAGKLQFYTFFGSHLASVVQQFTRLVGRQPLPPRWALGNFMSRFGYRSQQEVMDIAARMQQEGFPFDAVIIDLFWFGDGEHTRWNMGNFDWNLQRFPEPEKMIDSLKKQNIKTILIAEPFVLSESFNYAETQQRKLNAVDKNGDTIGIKEFYFGHAGLLDITKNETKAWFWNKYDAQIKKGVEGWWGDLGEPEKHPDYLYHNLQDMGFPRLFNADEVHNIYGHWWSRMLFENYAKHYPNTRLFHLNRSGYAGTWRYGSFPWSGDVDRSWKGLKAQLPIMLGMSLCGVPYMHSDAGGFAMGERDPELYTRWLQMSVFSPIFRPHGSVNAPDPSIPQIESEPVFYEEPYKSILRGFVKLRYQLLPYTYTLAYEAAHNGKPLVRPMFFYQSADSNLFKAEDQYMFGDAFLVAPILEKGSTVRRLYLPQGEWYDFGSNQKMRGGQWVEVPVKLHEIPVFVKAGSIVPMTTAMATTAEYFQQPLNIIYFPASGKSRYELYEDDGVSKNALTRRQYELTTIEAQTNDKELWVKIAANKGSYANKPKNRNITLKIPGLARKPTELLLNGRLIKIQLWQGGQTQPPTANIPVLWDERNKMLVVQMQQFTGDAVSIVVKR